MENLTEMLKGVLEVTGSDDLIKDSKTYADISQESVDQEVNKALKKVRIKQSKGEYRDGKSN